MTTIDFEDVPCWESLITACQYDEVVVNRNGKAFGLFVGVELMSEDYVAKLNVIAKQANKNPEQTTTSKLPLKKAATKAKKAVVK